MASFKGLKGIDKKRAFWSKVDRSDEFGCWPYTEYKDADGYGRFHFENGPIGAHVYAWILTRGMQVPEEKMILHQCDNRFCCQPAHLYCGTQLDNMRDRAERGPKVPVHILANPKLHEGEIWLIRRLKIVKSKSTYTRYKFSESFVAKMFKVDQSLIHLIWNSDKWLCKEGIYV